MVSYDVTGLFTNTPVPDALRVIRRRLEEDVTLPDRTTLSVDDVMELLTFCATSTYMMGLGKIYQQREGFAMGSPVSLLASNIFMEWFEVRALDTAPHVPSFWARYVDDTFVVIREEYIDEFTTHINNISPTIKFTMEREENHQLPMLDTLIHRKDTGSTKITIYRKPTHTDQYLLMDSHHPLQHKLGVIRTLVHRAESLVTEEEDKVLELEKIQKALGVCGYKRSHFAVANTHNPPNRQPSTTAVSKGSITLPYVRGASEGLRRILCKRGIQVHFKPRNTLRQFLVSPKDKINKTEKCHTVYNIQCQNCNAAYIGETKRPLGIRVSEHRREPSPVAEHAKKTGHSIPTTDAKILDTDPSWVGRGVREAAHIRQSRSSLNRDGGRYYLPAVYTSLLRRPAPSDGAESQ
ncbi:uncharacterized protein [Amphiura filiformis]|uniref:uncharacterized protein n=1 Tax=Amphiura filiformis TaxID=82378 RepID=UPI003B228A9E